MSKDLKCSGAGTQWGCGTGFTGGFQLKQNPPLARRMQRAPAVVSANAAAGQRGVPVGLRKGDVRNPVLSGVVIWF